jgi:eukaryotic-like serine/threonine-protein kinase
MPELIGKTLGRYHILEQLGEGGMAVVYRAFDTRLETDVAVKVIRTENLAPNVLDRVRKRFEREAKALAKLTHPNIVKITDYGEHDGIPYLVMPLLPGGTLKRRVGKPTSWEVAVRDLILIAEALGYAHKHKIIHRDIKPSNILITETGEPMITDFGVAKVFELEETQDLTGTGVGVGTPEYMAPEQGLGQLVDGRADIYALGIMLYEMLTGRKPYRADTPMAVMLKKATEPIPRPSKYLSGLPNNVEKVLLKTLAKNPENRYRNMGEVVRDFEKLLKDVREAEPKKRKVVREVRKKKERKSIPLKPILWGMLGLAGAGLLYGVFNWYSSQGAAERQPLPTITPTSITATARVTSTSVTNSTLENIPAYEATSTPEYGIGSNWERPTDGMTMMYIPSGEFEMGSDDGGKDEKPVHAVYLDAYWVDQTEVTNTMYAQCWQEKVCDIPTSDKYIRSYEYRNHPVVYISWDDASTYCEWADARLPTEAEWEKAARGNTNGVYPWGSVINKTYANYHGNEGNTQPVGVYSRSQNVYGLDDMAGNVWEFTADWYSSDYYSISPTKNPTGPEQDDALKGDRRVARGGSWGSTAEDLRVYSRHSFNPTSTGNAVGFRCARAGIEIIEANEETSSSSLDVGSTKVRPADGMTMMYVPAGEFEMGSEDGDSDEQPVHTVYLDAFWIDEHEVTNFMFAEFLNQEGNQSENGAVWYKANDSNVQVVYSEDDNWLPENGYENYPIVEVSWFGANAYCESIGARLPTESEWEKAARGGLAGQMYPWGAEEPVCTPGAENGARFSECGTGPINVKSFSANNFGLYDLSGNVWEWVSDWYGISFYVNSPNENPEEITVGAYRSLRGGGWGNSISSLRTADRGRIRPENANNLSGFRCARDVE